MIQKLIQLGLIFHVAAGIQIDITVVRKSDGSEGSLCDHNCTLAVGNYDCPAAFTKNRGMNKKFAPVSKIVEWVVKATEAQRKAREEFVRNASQYFDQFRFPDKLRGPICDSLQSGKTEVNLFAGNPEMHPEVIEISARLQALGFVVNFTTTGRKFITNSTYLAKIVQNPPHLIAVSADDLDLERFEYLSGLELDALRGAWRLVDPLHGQEQKFIEAIYTSRLFAGRPAPKILYNMVVHPGNLKYVEELICSVNRAFPSNLVNPYPAQSSFLHEGNIFTPKHLKELERFVDLMMSWSKDPTSPITKRLHYWLALKAVFETHRHDPNRVLQMLSGYDTWRCYRNPSVSYLQIGRGMQGSADAGAVPGGKLGCFWNDQTVSQETPVMSEAQVTGYLLTGMHGRAQESANPCRGCLMPRLMFNSITMELGLDPELLPVYFELRKEHVGF